MSKSRGNTAAKRSDWMRVGAPFLPGQSGYPSGRPKGLRNSKTIRRELLEIAETVTSGLTGESHEWSSSTSS
ncbi:DUF5681 domain-containing protein [Mesorhizobium salmacidum]|uniref:DUF5681 domain-containing protein n=1 Tax=Mesorhizobium salmacidum TaxID=3015171 RepID=UPI0039F488ED